jgi:copper chaperone CopZ
MKLALLLLISCAIPSLAQFRTIEMTFKGIGCASCIESLPERLRRLRGVESAVIDDQAGTVTVRLATKNRVRLEQIRDFIEQDGTKAVKAAVEVAGEVTKSDGRWILEPASLGTQYELEGTELAIAAGPKRIWGEAPALHPASGRMIIRVSRMD